MRADPQHISRDQTSTYIPQERGMNMLQIREMRGHDIPEKAVVHAQTWRETYAGMLPDELNAHITPQLAECLAHEQADWLTTLVALWDGHIVGYASFSAARERLGRADATELCNLYVLRSHQGLGVGRALVDAVRERIGESDLVLTVFARNEQAQGFLPARWFLADGTEGPRCRGGRRAREAARAGARATLGEPTRASVANLGTHLRQALEKCGPYAPLAPALLDISREGARTPGPACPQSPALDARTRECGPAGVAAAYPAGTKRT